MSTFRVTNRATGEEVIRYAAQMAMELDWPFAYFEHAEIDPEAPVEAQVDPTRWRIYVGSFFDRFGDAKIPILASDHPVVQALITDASVRQYIALVERKPELVQMLGLLQTLVPDAVLDVAAILETEPTNEERWHGE